MKNLLTQLVVASVLLVCIGCNKRSQTRKHTIIDGKVTNLQVYPEYKKFTLVVGDVGERATTYSGSINKDGTFKIYFDQYIDQDVYLTPIVRTFIAHPGDSIHIDIDFKNIGTVKFSGDASKLNSDLYHYVNENYVYYDPDMLRKYRNTMDTANFRTTCLNMRAELMQKRQDFIDKTDPDEELKTWTKNYVNLKYYNALFDFRALYYMRNRRSPAGINPILDYAMAPADINEMYNDKIITSGSYKLTMYLGPLANSAGTIDGKILERGDLFVDISQANTNPILKQMMLGRAFSNILTMNHPEIIDQKKQYLDSIKEPFIKQPLLKYYKAVKANLANPKLESDTIYKEMAGTSAQTLVDSLKKVYKGKVLYIDFGATWCAPCLGEIPYWQKMEAQYKGKDVVFVSVCVLSGYKEWLQMREKYKMDGIQLFCTDKISGGVFKGLHIDGVPYYVLIDKKGYITDKGSQFRPDQFTADRLNKLLMQ